MDCAVEDDRTIVIDEWVGECTVRFWKSRSSNNEHIARCRGCSMVVPLAYGLHDVHVYAEEPRLTICLTSTKVHWQIFTMNGFKWEMVVCQIPLSLSAEVDVNRPKDCDVSANQSRCSKLSTLHRWSVNSYRNKFYRFPTSHSLPCCLTTQRLYHDICGITAPFI